MADALRRRAPWCRRAVAIRSGHLYEATVLADVTQRWGRAGRDIRPGGALFRFKDESDVIATGRTTPKFGLASYFYAKDLARVFRVAEALEYGMVVSIPPDLHGGGTLWWLVKLSGLGREGSKIRHRGIHGDQICLPRRHRLRRALSKNRPESSGRFFFLPVRGWEALGRRRQIAADTLGRRRRAIDARPEKHLQSGDPRNRFHSVSGWRSPVPMRRKWWPAAVMTGC